MADILEVSPEYLPVGASPLHLAANNEDIKTLSLLLADPAYSDVDLADKHGRSPLVVALENGRFAAARVLIEHGANLDVRFAKRAMTAREALFLPDFHLLLEMLVEHGVRITPSSAVSDAFAGLMHSVAYEGNVGFLKALLEQYELDVNVKDNLLCTPLHYSVQRSHLTCVNILLAHGADPGATNGLKLTCVHVACRVGNLRVLQMLMDSRESSLTLLNAQDCTGRTPLHIALYHSQFDAYIYLVSRYNLLLNTSLVDINGHTLQTLSFTIRFSLHKPQPPPCLPCLSSEEATWALHESVASGHHEGVCFALEQGAIIDCYDFMQQTPLLAAAKQGSVEVCQTLVNRGANINLTDMAGRTPLYYAAAYGHHRIFAFLLSLPEVDLRLFYSLYDRPLSTDTLESLLQYFESKMAVFPDDGLKWLSLAASCATVQMFRTLCGYICKETLVHTLLSVQDRTSEKFQPIQLQGPFLSACHPYEHKAPAPQRNLFRVLEYSKRTAFKETVNNLQSPTVAFRKFTPIRMTYKFPLTCLMKGNRKVKLSPFQFNFACKKSYSPLFEAVRHTNVDVFDFILHQAVGANSKKQLLSVKDEHQVMLLNRVAEKWKDFSSVIQSHNLTNFVLEQLELQFALPECTHFVLNKLEWQFTRLLESMPLEVALMYHVFTGGSNRLCSGLPLSKWPDWYIDLKLQKQHSLNLLSLQHEDSGKSFVTTLVESGVYEKWYACLLHAAVVGKCQWGARLLLCQGHSLPGSVSYISSQSRHVLVEACHMCDTDMIRLLLHYNDHPLLKPPRAQLLQGLVTLANHGFIECTEQVFTKFIRVESAWNEDVRTVARLLYVVFNSKGGETIGMSLLNSLVCHVCQMVLKSYSQASFKVLFNALLQCNLSIFSHNNNAIKLILELAIFIRQYCHPTLSFTLHYLCGLGRINLVQFMLLSNPSLASLLVNHLDDQNRSPLYYASCGGHVKIVKLLIESGYNYGGMCSGYNSTDDVEEPPILGYLAHLSFAPRIKKPFNHLSHECPILKNKIFPCFISPAYNVDAEKVSPSNLRQLLVTLMDHSGDFLTTFSLLSRKYSCPTCKLHILYILAAVEDHFIIEPLLDLMLGDPCSFNANSLTEVMDVLHRLPFTVSVLDVIISRSTHHFSSKFESILKQCSIIQPIKYVHLCARKGYWKLLLGSLSTDIMPEWSEKALVLAAKHGQNEVVSALCHKYHYKQDVSLRSALRYAVASNHLSIVKTLQKFAVRIALEQCTCCDNTTALRMVISNNPKDMFAKHIQLLVAMAARKSCVKTLEYLLQLYCDSDFIFDSQFADRKLSFWYSVLMNSAWNGHEALCLQAVACISDSQMLNIVVTLEDKFIELLHCCCYWGMADLLECLPVGSCENAYGSLTSAIRYGHSGKLSHVQLVTSAVLLQLKKESHGSLKSKNEKDSSSKFISAAFCGSFHKLCSLIVQRKTMPELTNADCIVREVFERTYWNNTYGQKQYTFFYLLEAIMRGHLEIVETCISHVGHFSAAMLCCMKKSIHLAVSTKRDNVSVLEFLLKIMFNDGFIDKEIEKVEDNLTPLTRAVSNRLVGCTSLLLKWKAKNFTSPKTGNTVLHLAVKSGHLELVKLLLNNLKGVTDLLTHSNLQKMDPISYAYSLGKGRIAYELIQRVPGKHHCDDVLILPAKGWFRIMVHHEPALPHSTHLPDFKAFHMNIREIPNAVELFKAAAKGNYPVLKAIFLACGRRFPVRDFNEVLQLFPHSTFVQLLEKEHNSIDFELFTHTETLSGILRNCLVKSRLKPMLQILRLFSVPVNDSSLLSEIFLAACLHKELEMVQYLLDSHPVLVQDGSLLEEGVALAICNGSYDIAAFLMLDLRVAYNASCFPPGAQPSKLIEMIFSTTSYHRLLDELFHSIVNRGVSERLPLAAAWTVHKWTERQCQLITRNLGGPCSPSNPWLLTVDGKGGSRDVVLSVDWDTFSECLVHSPHIGTTSSKFNPLLLETTILSPAILGRICERFTYSGDINCTLVEQTLSSLILTCVLWPSKPSLSTFMDEQGILTVSYNPQIDTVIFPKAAPMNVSDIDCSFSTDSGIQNESKLSSDWELREEFRCIADSHIVAFKQATGDKAIAISIVFGDAFYYHFEDISIVASTVDATLSDCFGILKLCRKPHVFYSSIYQQVQSMKIPFLFSTPKGLFRRLQIHVCLVESGDSDPQVISLTEEESTDTVSIILPIKKAPSSEVPPSVPSYEALIAKLSDRLLEGEVESLKAKVSRSIARVLVPQLKKSLGYFSLDPDTVTLSVEDQQQVIRKYGDFKIEDLVHLKWYKRVMKVLLNLARMLNVFSFKPRLQSSVRSMLEPGLKLCITNEQSSSTFFLKAGVAHITVSLSDIHRGTSHLSLLDMFDSILRTTSWFRRSELGNLFNGIPAPFACAIDKDNSLGLFYPKLGSVGVVSVKLIDYNKKELSSPLTSTCIVSVRIITPTEKIITGSSLEETGLAPNKSVNILINNARAIVRWTPKEVGLHQLSFKVNGTEISDGMVKVYVPHPPDQAECNWQIHEGSCGSRNSSAGEPIVFIASQTCHPCGYQSAKPPRIVLKGRKSVKAAVCSPSKGGTVVMEWFNSSKPQHYISVYSFFGSSQNWQLLKAGDISVHISRSKKERQQSSLKLEAFCTPLGNGQYRVALWTTTAGSFSVFPSCPNCQAVMHIRWRDQLSFDPSLCHIFSGPFSSLYSDLSLTPNLKGNRKRKNVKGNLVVSVTAGGAVELFLRARDAFGNPHPAEGAVKKVVIEGAGLRNGGMEGGDVECKITDNEDGLYSIAGNVFCSGLHIVSVLDQCGKKHAMLGVTLKVDPSTCSAQHCELYIPNREAVVGEIYFCALYLQDYYGNPITASYTGVKGVANGQRMGVMPLEKALFKYAGMLPELDIKPNCFVLSFTPRSHGKKEMLVTVNNVLLPLCPIELSVIRSTQSFANKIKLLRTTLREKYGSAMTSTITMDRANLLESAITMLQEHHFKNIIRIRFGDEPGVDVGGPSREFFHLLCLEFINPQYALFQSVNGLYRPNPNSAVNPNHLFYFNFFGKILAKTICDGHHMMVRFTPAVYKFLLQQECTLDDLKIEDPSLHTGLLQIMASESNEQLEQIALNFTASMTNFGTLRTIELEHGGEHRKVTLANRHEFVHKLFSWHLIGCVGAQLNHLQSGFQTLISAGEVEMFLPHELEVLLSGPSEIDLAFIRSRTQYQAGYSSHSQVVKWFWQILDDFSQEERSQFLQFTTGCACHPTVDMGQWDFVIQRGSDDPTLLPTAATCFNTLSIPPYSSKELLQEKLSLAISYGRESFLRS